MEVFDSSLRVPIVEANNKTLSQLTEEIATNDAWLFAASLPMFNAALSLETKESITSLVISLAIFAMWLHGVGQEIANYKNNVSDE